MLRVEIADTPSKHANGLMFRQSLANDSGMIFVFKRANKLRFWGVNTYIPLDIAFVDSEHRIAKIATISPLSDKTVESEADCCIAIEANLGFFERNRIHVGDKVDFKKLSERMGVVDFCKPAKTAQFIGTKSEGSEGVNVSESHQAPPPPTNQNNDQALQQNADVVQQQNGPLPVISISDLNGILEDSYDEPGGSQPSGEMDERGQPDQPPVPEVSPQHEQQEEEPEPFDMPDEDYPEFGSSQEALNWAQREGEVVRIWYQTKGGRDIEREVEPHGQFVAESSGNPIVVTFDETIGDIRAFIVTKILFYTFVGKEFSPKFVVRR